jgi:hypothetical protein
MTKVRIEKIDGNYRLEIDGDSHSHFSSTASDLITKPFTVSSRCNGIFDTNTRFPEFANDSKVFTVDVGSSWSISDYANPVAEINRRVKLVRDTFAKAEAEKEVWEVEIGVELETCWVLECQDTGRYPYTDWISCDIGRYATKAAAELKISTLAWDGRRYRATERLAEPEDQPEVFTIIYVDEYGSGCRDVVTLRDSELLEYLGKYANPPFVFRGEHESV